MKFHPRCFRVIVNKLSANIYNCIGKCALAYMRIRHCGCSLVLANVLIESFGQAIQYKFRNSMRSSGIHDKQCEKDGHPYLFIHLGSLNWSTMES